VSGCGATENTENTEDTESLEGTESLSSSVPSVASVASVAEASARRRYLTRSKNRSSSLSVSSTSIVSPSAIFS
jgi:hypothetical protein